MAHYRCIVMWLMVKELNLAMEGEVVSPLMRKGI
jgi:hypothetical protein